MQVKAECPPPVVNAVNDVIVMIVAVLPAVVSEPPRAPLVPRLKPPLLLLKPNRSLLLNKPKADLLQAPLSPLFLTFSF